MSIIKCLYSDMELKIKSDFLIFLTQNKIWKYSWSNKIILYLSIYKQFNKWICIAYNVYGIISHKNTYFIYIFFNYGTKIWRWMLIVKEFILSISKKNYEADQSPSQTYSNHFNEYEWRNYSYVYPETKIMETKSITLETWQDFKWSTTHLQVAQLVKYKIYALLTNILTFFLLGFSLFLQRK